MTEQNILGRLSAYIAAAGGRPLPEAVSEKAKHHILDTLAAMVSGIPAETGRAGHRLYPPAGEPRKPRSSERTFSPPHQRRHGQWLYAHADETDDSHAPP